MCWIFEKWSWTTIAAKSSATTALWLAIRQTCPGRKKCRATGPSCLSLMAHGEVSSHKVTSYQIEPQFVYQTWPENSQIWALGGRHIFLPSAATKQRRFCSFRSWQHSGMCCLTSTWSYNCLLFPRKKRHQNSQSSQCFSHCHVRKKDSRVPCWAFALLRVSTGSGPSFVDSFPKKFWSWLGMAQYFSPSSFFFQTKLGVSSLSARKKITKDCQLSTSSVSRLADLSQASPCKACKASANWDTANSSPGNRSFLHEKCLRYPKILP